MKEKDKSEILSAIKELSSAQKNEQATELDYLIKQYKILKAQVDDNSTLLLQMKAALISYNKKKEMTASKTVRKMDKDSVKAFIPGYNIPR